VRNMSAMFAYAKAFSKKDLSGWNVKKVTNHDYFMTFSGSGNTEPKWR
jgi:surface protein